MAYIIQELPFYARNTQLPLPGGGVIDVFPFQIVLWASIAAKEKSTLTEGALKFPILLDTGLNVTLTMRSDHFRNWLPANPALHQSTNVTKIDNDEVKWFSCNVWIWPVQPKTLLPKPRGKPTRLDLPNGIGVYTKTSGRPRIPTLGLRALTANGVVTTIDGARRCVTMRIRS